MAESWWGVWHRGPSDEPNAACDRPKARVMVVSGPELEQGPFWAAGTRKEGSVYAGPWAGAAHRPPLCPSPACLHTFRSVFHLPPLGPSPTSLHPLPSVVACARACALQQVFVWTETGALPVGYCSQSLVGMRVSCALSLMPGSLILVPCAPSLYLVPCAP